jgi:hypothetical protein
MQYQEQELIEALEASFKAYKDFVARSNAKLKPIHKFFADTLASIWGRAYTIHFLGKDNKEKKIEGKYYPKYIDITVAQNGQPCFCMGIKFVISNYKQNTNNYIENMMGETANIQADGNLPYAQILILRRETPYYLKNKTEKPSKIEIKKKKNIIKYLNLIFDNPQAAHRPKHLGIQIIDIDEKTGKVLLSNIDNLFSKDTVDLLNEKLSLRNFFSEIETYRNLCKN